MLFVCLLAFVYMCFFLFFFFSSLSAVERGPRHLFYMRTFLLWESSNMKEKKICKKNSNTKTIALECCRRQGGGGEKKKERERRRRRNLIRKKKKCSEAKNEMLIVSYMRASSTEEESRKKKGEKKEDKEVVSGSFISLSLFLSFSVLHASGSTAFVVTFFPLFLAKTL